MLVPPLQLYDMVGYDCPVSNVALPGTAMLFCNGEFAVFLVFVPFHYTYFLF